MHRTRNRQPGALAASIGTLAAFLALTSAAAEPAPIVLDGLYGDWAEVEPAHFDAEGDGGASGVDFGRVWIADDPEFLYLFFEVGTELLLSDGHSVTLYLDTDMNAATGLSVGEIGAELKWSFGLREGTYYRAGSSWSVDQADIDFRAFPSVTSTVFEIAIGRQTYPVGYPLFFGSTFRMILRDNTGGGDWLPDGGTSLPYTFDDGPPPERTAIPLARYRADDVRITSLNVLFDSPWEPGQAARFGRLFAAARPEILNFQEIYDHSHIDTRQLVEQWLPSEPEESWYSAGNGDCHTVSRYPLAGIWSLDGNLAVLLDTSDPLGRQILIVNCHLPCCENDAGRQAEVDRILSFLRDAQSPGGAITLPEGTAILLTGDMNFVGDAQQLESFLTGDVVDEGTWGEDFPPDWDGTDLANLVSRLTEKGMAYTWRKDYGSYWPSHLDYMIYTDSALEPANHYVLYTPEMSADTLTAHGLQGSDSQATDHLLVVADFRPPPPAGAADGPPDPSIAPLRIHPNPSTGTADAHLDLARPALVSAELFDGRGRRVALPLGAAWVSRPAGRHPVTWSVSDGAGRPLVPGIYFLRVRIRDAEGERTARAKWSLVR